jgi:diguanylate cyclase (GGDEF)-like protein
MTLSTLPNSSVPPVSDQSDAVYREALVLLYRGMTNAMLGHMITSGFVVYALWPVVDNQRLLAWGLVVWAVALVRGLGALRFLHLWPQLGMSKLPFWQHGFVLMTLMQTSLWGSVTVFVWPETLTYKALLVAVLVGIIAAGGVMLAVQRRSFWFYCLPIAVPAIFVLLLDGGRLERVMAALVLLFSLLMLVSVNRLTSIFLDGLDVRFKMQALSRIDALTDLPNRRSFDEFFSDAWQHSVRAGQSLGVLLLDVDFFKKYNDRYGHPRGDEALRQLATVLQRVASRSTDMCARIGGEEFAVIVPTTDLQGARLVAQQIIDQLAAEGIVHSDSPSGILTVSIGIKVGVPGRHDTRESFIDAADQALYRAKGAGRDRIEIAADDMVER